MSLRLRLAFARESCSSPRIPYQSANYARGLPIRVGPLAPVSLDIGATNIKSVASFAWEKQAVSFERRRGRGVHDGLLAPET